VSYGAVLSGSIGYARSSDFGSAMAGGANSTTSVINAIAFTPSAGTFTSGSIEIWGNP
jgi:hypothetical protein